VTSDFQNAEAGGVSGATAAVVDEGREGERADTDAGGDAALSGAVVPAGNRAQPGDIGLPGEVGLAFPKPTRRVKEPKRLKQVSDKRAARIAAGEERSGLARTSRLKARGNTAYANRERETGFMLFTRSTLPCAARAVEGIDPCRGVLQFAHLGDRTKNGGFRKCPDGEGGCLCAHHHQQVDNPTGWSGREGFYLRMSPPEREVFRGRAMLAAVEAWLELVPAQREWWDNRAAQLNAEREARRAAS